MTDQAIAARGGAGGTGNQRQRFPGIHTVLYALFDSAERLDREAMRRQVEQVIAYGSHGITVLGLATEVQKLSFDERRTVIDWAAQDIGQRVPLSVTVAGNSVDEQCALAGYAEQAGASWLILQPPAVGQFAADQYIGFFGRVAQSVSLPMAIQNAPAYLGRGLTNAEIGALIDAHPNFTHLKGEDNAVQTAALADMTGSRLTMLNGRAGLEMPDNLRAGCQGFILAPDTADFGVRIYRQWQAGATAQAEADYARALPAITFVMQSIETLICYGKRLYGLRAGVDIYDRAPYLAPTGFGMQCLARYADSLGALKAAD